MTYMGKRAKELEARIEARISIELKVRLERVAAARWMTPASFVRYSITKAVVEEERAAKPKRRNGK